jgi:hypothetical protein
VVASTGSIEDYVGRKEVRKRALSADFARAGLDRWYGAQVVEHYGDPWAHWECSNA